MKDIAIDCVLSGKTKLNPSKRKHCFELFGLDFILDEDYRTWLLEVNTNPYLGTPNKQMEVLVPAMVDEMLTIVLDPIYPPAQESVIENPRWELIYCEESGVNQRQPFKSVAQCCYPIPDKVPFIGKKDKPPIKLHKPQP